MTCDKWLEQISAYVDDELTESERRAVEAHVHECAACRETLEAFRVDKTLFVTALASENLTLREKVMQEIGQLPQPRTAWWKWWQHTAPTVNIPQRRRFTFVELAVVVGLMSVLAAVLLPVFTKARERSRHVSTQSDLKQLHAAMVMYTQDYDEKQLPDNLRSRLFTYGYFSHYKSSNDPYLLVQGKRTPYDHDRTDDIDPRIAKAGVPFSFDVFTSPPVPPPPGKESRLQERHLAYEGELIVRVRRAEDTLSQAERLVDQHGGFSLDSHLIAHEGTPARAMLVCRVPVNEFRSTLLALSKLGVMEERKIAGEDLTTQYVDAQEQIESAQKSATRLQDIQRRSRKTTDSMKVEEKTQETKQTELEQRTRLRGMKARTDLATIAVTFFEREEKKPVSRWSKVAPAFKWFCVWTTVWFVVTMAWTTWKRRRGKMVW